MKKIDFDRVQDTMDKDAVLAVLLELGDKEGANKILTHLSSGEGFQLSHNVDGRLEELSQRLQAVGVKFKISKGGC